MTLIIKIIGSLLLVGGLDAVKSPDCHVKPTEALKNRRNSEVHQIMTTYLKTEDSTSLEGITDLSSIVLNNRINSPQTEKFQVLLPANVKFQEQTTVGTFKFGKDMQHKKLVSAKVSFRLVETEGGNVTGATIMVKIYANIVERVYVYIIQPTEANVKASDGVLELALNNEEVKQWIDDGEVDVTVSLSGDDVLTVDQSLVLGLLEDSEQKTVDECASGCCLMKYHVNLNEMVPLILAPHTVDIGMCVGSCESNEDGNCCVPSEYGSIKVLQRVNDEVAVQTIPGVLVTSCACKN